MHDLIVIGGGPAGLSAAAYALGKELDAVLIYERLGGKVGWSQSLAAVEAERQLPGNEVVRLLQLRAAKDRGRMIQDRVDLVQRLDIGFRVVTRQHGALDGAVVIVATGASPLRLKVPGAQRLVDHGLGYSIRTYAHLVHGKRVAVVGTTPRALRGVAELARGARHVFVIAPSQESIQTRTVHALRRRPNVEFLVGYGVAEVLGDDRLTGLRLEHNDRTIELAVEHAFVDLGLVPNSNLVHDLVKHDSRGFIEIDRFNATSVPGIFAAGDVTNAPVEQVLVAVGDGARAAMSAYDYLLAWGLASTLGHARS